MVCVRDEVGEQQPGVSSGRLCQTWQRCGDSLFKPHRVACRMLFPQPGIKPGPSNQAVPWPFFKGCRSTMKGWIQDLTQPDLLYWKSTLINTVFWRVFISSEEHMEKGTQQKSTVFILLPSVSTGYTHVFCIIHIFYMAESFLYGIFLITDSIFLQITDVLRFSVS